jgi:hypothetical protein
MEKEILKKLRKSLPVGYARILKERMNNKFSLSMIIRVINGERNNLSILNAAIELAEEYKNEQLERKEKIIEIYQK